MTTKRPTDEEFYAAYEALAEQGHCDGAGGGEYERVLAEWNQLGRPTPLATFIRRRANSMPIGMLKVYAYRGLNSDPLEHMEEAMDRLNAVIFELFSVGDGTVIEAFPEPTEEDLLRKKADGERKLFGTRRAMNLFERMQREKDGRWDD